MTALLLLASLALAQDTPQIMSVPEGSTLTRPGKAAFAIDYQAYLLPEPHYDSCLSSAQNLPLCKESLAFCEEQSDWSLTQARETFQLARDQFDADEDQVAKLTEQVVQLDSDLVRTKEQLRMARSQRNLAWGVAGGLVLGAVAVTAVAIGG
jgi:hypothetical protein